MNAPIVRRLAVVALGALALVAARAEAGELHAVVKDQQGAPVAEAVVVLVPRGATPALRPGRETVDQIDKEFVPHVKALVAGSSVFFPNKDNIRHHVYSFSPVKTFELPLYVGTPAKPVVFDRAGIVTIGCNIHDWMIGHIYVAETPYVGTTDKDGKVTLEGLPGGGYTARVWHPRLEGAEQATSRPLALEASGAVTAAWQLTLRPELRPRRAPVPGARGYR
ncbi:MAG TPA: methylamine utilization protein [Terriglobales bacterium]|nr:methylamine utilization protein [Terriglobales bacterium]